jgi:SAM-dependent methyltransferase
VNWTARRARPTVPPDFLAADEELAGTLDALDDGTNYASWIAELVAPYLGDEVLEVGAGHGTITERIAGPGRRVVATDLSERCVDVLRERFAAASNVEVRLGPIEAAAPGGPYDSAVLINVLEHIPDDQQALTQLSDLLKPGGRLVLWVPAFDFLYSEFDRKIGHYRRYRIPQLRPKLAGAGFEVNDIRYVNTVGAIGWLMIARLLRRDPVAGGAAKLFDKFFVPVLRVVERHFRPPFGQSVFVAAVRLPHP